MIHQNLTCASACLDQKYFGLPLQTAAVDVVKFIDDVSMDVYGLLIRAVDVVMDASITHHGEDEGITLFMLLILTLLGNMVMDFL